MPEKPRSTATLSVLIVDDEQLARDELSFLLKSFPRVEVVATASNGPEAIALIEEHEPDLVFMDVQMPGLDGLSVVRKLIEGGSRLPHFIFATAYDQYAVEAFEVNAVDYLLKPIDKDRLAMSLERAQARLEAPAQGTSRMEQLLEQLQSSVRPRTKLLVKSSNRMFLVDANDVIYATIQDGLISIVSAYIEGLCIPVEHGKYEGVDASLQVNKGKELYEKQCLECHGKNGEGDKAKFYPVIAGQHYKYLLRQMTEIRDGHRRNANPDMVKVIKPYTDDQLVAISAYQASLKMPGAMCAPKVSAKK